MIENNGFKELITYKKAFKASMDIYEISKGFPKEEKYSLTDQIRRSSRSVCANIAEGYRKRKYPKYFITKLIDADGECSETMVWLEFACKCNFITINDFICVESAYKEIGKLLGYMINNHHKFL
ncbi:MAG: four helix bundle protein [Bacteroidetes bacterium]|nr:four helix bundle protein [Bacteroidota bacterium]